MHGHKQNHRQFRHRSRFGLRFERLENRDVPAIVLAYGFNENSGSTVGDASGNALNGNLAGATWTTAGKYGGALSFNGTNARVDVVDAALLDLTTAMTLEAWVNPTATNSWRSVLLKERPGGMAYGLYSSNNPNPGVFISTSGGADQGPMGSAALPANSWSHIAGTFNGSTVQLYVNGVLVGSQTVSGSILTSSDALRIGGNAVWGEWFSGVIDEVRIYNNVRTQAEIQSDMNTPVQTSTGGPLQATLVGGTFSEGGSGQISFTNSSGGSGGYLYSFDFDNNGTFEITDSSTPSATLPATYLKDGPASLVVHGRIKDSKGAFVDYTAPVTINNVAPTVQLTAPSAGTPGTALNFSASVSDPSTVDTAAGFTYAWNFGDSGTSTQSAPSHTFASAGVYTVTLTVRDKDNAPTVVTSQVTIGSVTTSTITTPFDIIPNFGANPTISATKNGNWSDPSTWTGNRVPAAGDVVAIGANRNITYDVFSDVQVKTVAVQPGGSLAFRTDINTRLTVINFLVMQGGTLQIGTAANPVASNVKAEVIFPDVPLDTANDPAQFGNGLIGLGKVTMHGSVRSDSFVRLTNEPLAGQMSLTLAQPVAGWQVGDKLILPDSRQWRIGFETYVPRYEEVIIATISPDGRTISLTTPIQFDHPAARDGNNVVSFMPHVANRTRNVVVKSGNISGSRGHAFFSYRADVDIRYVTFGGLGRTRIDPIDDTTFNGSGNATHIGTNQSARNPVTFSHLFGPQTTPANGYQYTFIGNAVTCGLPTHRFKWGVTVNDSHYGLIKDNVVYNWAGAGIATQSGNESYNVIEENFVFRGRGEGDREGSGIPGSEGSAFWFQGPNNYIRDNVGGNYTNPHTEASYGFKFYFKGPPNIRIPNYQGADTSIASQYTMRHLNQMPLLEFDNNEVYGNENGLTIWWLNAIDYNPQNGGTSTVKNFHSWHVAGYNFYGYPMADVVFDGYVVRGDMTTLANGYQSSNGMWFADYMTHNFVLRNSDIQGTRWGFYDPMFSGSTTIIEDSFFLNTADITINTPNAGGSDPDGSHRQPKTTMINNVRFGPNGNWNFGGNPRLNINMNYINSGSSNLIVRDDVFVQNYNGVAEDDFQVFYTQQASSFIVPQSNGNTVGSPVANQTNQQNWSQFQISIAGAVAPTGSGRVGISGFVLPISGPPEVNSIIVNNGGIQRSRVTSIEVVFDQIVTISGNPASAFQLKRQSDNATVNLNATVNNSGPGTRVTLTFSGGPLESQSLADGRYTLTVLAGSISNANGGLDGNGNGVSDGSGLDNHVLIGSPTEASKLFRMFGDNNGDGRVESDDFSAFRTAFGNIASTSFDSDNDSDVDANDYLAFRQRFGIGI